MTVALFKSVSEDLSLLKRPSSAPSLLKKLSESSDIHWMDTLPAERPLSYFKEQLAELSARVESKVKSNAKVANLQQDISTVMLSILKGCAEDGQQMLGKAPCLYAVFVGGSGRFLAEFSEAKWNAPILGAFHFASENSSRNIM